MANVHQLLIKSRFKGNLTTNCFLVPSSSFLRLGRRFGPHPNSIKSLHSSSCSLDSNAGASSVVTYDYDKVTNLNDALKSFNVMIHKRPLPSVVKFTRLLHDVTELKHYSCSLHLFKQMCTLGVPVNTYTAGIAIKCYHRLYRTKYGLAVLGSCLKQGVELHVSTYNTLFKGFVLNNTHLASKLFCDIARYRLCELNLVSYKIMIKGLCKIGNHFTAIGLLRLIDHGILDGGCKFDVVIYNTIFDSLSNDIIFIDYVFKLLKEMVFHKAILPNVHTYNSLIYNLSKLGRWDEVSRMLKQMEDANISPKVKTFNIIVDALCKQGKIDEARDVIDIMLETGGKYPPNIVTYNSLIDAYCWRNEVSEARKIYDSLASKCIKPNFVTENELVLGYIIDQNYKELKAFHNDLKSTVDVFLCFMSITSVFYKDANISFPHIGIYRSILEILTYEDAHVFFHLMDRSGLNSKSDVYDVIIERAIKHRKFDDARRLFHDLHVKGVKPFVHTYKLLIDGFVKAGLVRESLPLIITFCIYSSVIRQISQVH